MKILIALFLVVFSTLASAFDCMAIEYGGDGRDLTVGTTTSGTWYVWNCVNKNYTPPIGIPEGFVIVSGHKPSATCAAAGLNPFINFTDMYSKCTGFTAEEKVKYNRLLKSLETAKAKLPKEYP